MGSFIDEMASPNNKDFKSHSLKNSQSIKRSKLQHTETSSMGGDEDNISTSVKLPNYQVISKETLDEEDISIPDNN